MDPENMLSERSQAQEDHVLYESITWNAQNKQIHGQGVE
jgi:hypothetical protein